MFRSAPRLGLLALALGLVAPIPTSGQTCTGCANPHLPSADAMLTEGTISERFRLGAWVVVERRKELFAGRVEVDNRFQDQVKTAITMVVLDVRLTERAGVEAVATGLGLTGTTVVPGVAAARVYRDSFVGLGDVSLVGWYRLRPLRRWNTTLNLGASLPTARTEAFRFRPGTGTVDPLFGVAVSRRVQPFIVFGSLAARTPLWENDRRRRTGASWSGSAGVGKDLGQRVVGFGRLAWLHREQDVYYGWPTGLWGGNWLYLMPSAAVRVGKGLNVQAEVKVPVYRSVTATQLDSRAIFQFGISRAF